MALAVMVVVVFAAAQPEYVVYVYVDVAVADVMAVYVGDSDLLHYAAQHQLEGELACW
jgi:hypothetical protein